MANPNGPHKEKRNVGIPTAISAVLLFVSKMEMIAKVRPVAIPEIWRASKAGDLPEIKKNKRILCFTYKIYSILVSVCNLSARSHLHNPKECGHPRYLLEFLH